MDQSIKISVVVTLYKDLEALDAVLEGLKAQTYKNFEVIIAEDDNANETKEYIQKITNLSVKHISHLDVGRTKTVIQNKAICHTTGDYLVFLDGDTIPYPKYLEGTMYLANPKVVLAGRRFNLNAKDSQVIRKNPQSAVTMQKHFFTSMLSYMFDKESRFEQGISINPAGFIFENFINLEKRNSSILGCNWSCFKEDFVAINGFDESLGLSCLGDDTDLDWRFKASGCQLVSSKNVANVFHLYHAHSTKAFEGYNPQKDYDRYLENQKENIFYTKVGLDQHCDSSNPL